MTTFFCMSHQLCILLNVTENRLPSHALCNELSPLMAKTERT